MMIFLTDRFEGLPLAVVKLTSRYSKAESISVFMVSLTDANMLSNSKKALNSVCQYLILSALLSHKH